MTELLLNLYYLLIFITSRCGGADTRREFKVIYSGAVGIQTDRDYRDLISLSGTWEYGVLGRIQILCAEIYVHNTAHYLALLLVYIN